MTILLGHTRKESILNYVAYAREYFKAENGRLTKAVGIRKQRGENIKASISLWVEKKDSEMRVE